MVERKLDKGYESESGPVALGCSTPHCYPHRAPELSNPERPAWCDPCKRKWSYLISSVTPSTARSLVALYFSPPAFEAPGSFTDGFCFFKPSKNPGFALSLVAADEAILHGIACCRDKGSSPDQVSFLVPGNHRLRGVVILSEYDSHFSVKKGKRRAHGGGEAEKRGTICIIL